MGCDIHLHTEIKLDGVWHHYSSPNVPRNYVLFEAMAGVRACGEIAPVSDPKGLPDDMSEVTRRDAKYWEGDAHSHSWLGAKEVSALFDRWNLWIKNTRLDNWDFDLEHRYVGYFGRDGWKHFDPNSEGYLHAEDFRWVFWFDN